MDAVQRPRQCGVQQWKAMRIVVYGPSQSGKLKLIEQLLNNQFLDGYYDPSYWPKEEGMFGKGEFRKQVRIDEETVVLTLEMVNMDQDAAFGCDSATPPLYVIAALVSQSPQHKGFVGVGAIMCCYSIAKREQFERLCQEISKYRVERQRLASPHPPRKPSPPEQDAKMGLFSMLPLDVISLILKNLDRANLNSLRSCCKRLRIAVDERAPIVPIVLPKEHVRGSEVAPIVLVGTMADLQVSQRQVNEAEGKAFAASQGILFYETSAQNRVNVEEAFFDSVRKGREELRERAAAQEKKEQKKHSCVCM